jgi:DNA-binding NtrC family response regulator
MKHALILEKDATSSGTTARLLSSLGYMTAPVRTPEEALNVASAIRFDVIVTCTAKRMNDRRALTGELKRVSPKAAVILIAERGDVGNSSAWNSPGVSGVIERPASAKVIRQIVEFGIDGYGMQPAGVAALQERRTRAIPY